MELNKGTVCKLLGMAAFVVLLYWGLQNPASVAAIFGTVLALFAPFLVGACIAFILNVPMRFIETHLFCKAKKGPMARLHRPLSLALSLLLVIGIVFVVIFLVVPELGRTVDLIRQGLPHYWRKVQEWGLWLSAEIPELENWLSAIVIDWDKLQSAVLNFLQNDAGNFLSSTLGAVASVFSGVVTGFLGFVFSIYLLMQKETLGRQARSLLYAFTPEKWADWMLKVARLSNRTFSNFLSGQCAEAVILGSMFFVAMSITRFPYALLVGVLVGFTALIPVFGAFIGCAVGAFLILMVSPIRAFWFVVLFLILQQIEGNFIYPRVVGGSVGLPSIWVLLAVSIGASAMGILGMLIFIPLCSVLYSLLRESVTQRLADRGISAQKIRPDESFLGGKKK